MKESWSETPLNGDIRRCAMVGIAEKVREARLRWYGHVMKRNEGELVRDTIEWRNQKMCYGGHCREREGSKTVTIWYRHVIRRDEEWKFWRKR